MVAAAVEMARQMLLIRRIPSWPVRKGDQDQTCTQPVIEVRVTPRQRRLQSTIGVAALWHQFQKPQRPTVSDSGPTGPFRNLTQ